MNHGAKTKPSACAKLVQSAKQAYAQKQYARCVELCMRLLAQSPQHPEACYLIGYAHFKLGELNKAIDHLGRYLQINPTDGKAGVDVVVMLMHQRQYEAALNHLLRLSELHAETEDILYRLGFCYQELGQNTEALSLFSRLIDKNPRHIEAYQRTALLLHDMGRQQESLQLLDLALQVNPQSISLQHCQAMLMVLQGMLASAQGKFELLEAWGDKEVEHLIDHAELLTRMKQIKSAESKFKQALAIAPDHRRALTCYARLLFILKRHDEALALFERVIKKYPKDSATRVNIGNIFFSKRDFTQASEQFRLAYETNPQGPEIAGSYLYAISFICDWRNHDKVLKTIESDTTHTVSRTFPSVIFENSPKANLAYAQAAIRNKFMPTNILGALNKYERKNKIRIGYYSSDFYHHATVMLIEGMLREHDRSRFELHAFSLDFTREDAYNERVRKLFDQYHDVSKLSDGAVTLLSRQLEIDIAIDLKGFTEGSRTAIFAERAAPIQINYLGFPGSMGASYIDYMVADHYTITPENREFFTEKIIWMPDCYQPNNPGRAVVAPPSPRPAELPEAKFVFCSFNNTYKLTPNVFHLWLRILVQAPDSVLWLLKTTPEAEKNLLAEVRAAGLDVNRIAFAPLELEEDHLKRFVHADLFMDSFPCNAHTTASDALWSGVPLITRSGETFASRVAGSILHAVGLQELIVDSEESYEALALKIYNDKTYHLNLKRRVQEGVAHGALYDARRYTRYFERAMIEIHKRHHDGAPPEDLEVSALQPWDSVSTTSPA